MIKVADLNISADNCGPYVITLTGADAVYFKVINKELYFLLEKPYICKTSYTVTVSITDLANRFTPKTAVYNLSTPFCSCTTSTSTTITSTTVSPTTSTSTTASPFGLNFASLDNGAIIPSINGSMTNDEYIGPSAYSYSLNCNSPWPANGALCTGNSPNTVARSDKMSYVGSTWNQGPIRSAISPAHLVIDLGTIRTFNLARYYQIFSDGKATHAALDISSNGSLQGRTSAGWTEVHTFNLLDNSITSDGIGVVFPTTTARYLRLRLYNDGRYGFTTWVELYNFKLFFTGT